MEGVWGGRTGRSDKAEKEWRCGVVARRMPKITGGYASRKAALGSASSRLYTFYHDANMKKRYDTDSDDEADALHYSNLVGSFTHLSCTRT
jgi:hypothetical protein